MSKYDLSCTIQNTQHIALIGLLEFFFLLEFKIKQKCCTKHNKKKPAPSITVQSTTILFQKDLQKLIEV